MGAQFSTWRGEGGFGCVRTARGRDGGTLAATPMLRSRLFIPHTTCRSPSNWAGDTQSHGRMSWWMGKD
eukprot:171371-Chlamydomonas_euryale.AAC.1